jgi:hypothetical protein
LRRFRGMHACRRAEDLSRPHLAMTDALVLASSTSAVEHKQNRRM